jgi:galactose mutarotase-like enzyme
MADGCLTRAGKENVLIQSGECTVTLLPNSGGKIASIRVRKHELLQAPLTPIGPRTRTMAFDTSDASGWDECLPSVAACQVKTDAGVADLPDHGDLWRVEWENRGNAKGNRGQGLGKGDQPDTSVTLTGECFSLPLTLERTIALAEMEKGWQLRLEYVLTNTGRVVAPWSWAAHPLFAVDAGDRFELPASIKSLRVENSGGMRLGTAGNTIAWPRAKLAGGGETDLSLVQDEHSKIADKVFAGPLGVDADWCILHRPKAGLKIRLGFDPAVVPFLGIWTCYGGWPGRPGPKQMCVAIEPSTVPVDSLAKSGSWLRSLAPGGSFSWPLVVDIEST